jgi:hypothetical protein
MDQPRDQGNRQFEPDYRFFSHGIGTAASKLTGVLAVIVVAILTLGWVAIQLGRSGWWVGAIVAMVLLFLLAIMPWLRSGQVHAQDTGVDQSRANTPPESETDGRGE